MCTSSACLAFPSPSGKAPPPPQGPDSQEQRAALPRLGQTGSAVASACHTGARLSRRTRCGRVRVWPWPSGTLWTAGISPTFHSSRNCVLITWERCFSDPSRLWTVQTRPSDGCSRGPPLPPGSRLTSAVGRGSCFSSSNARTSSPSGTPHISVWVVPCPCAWRQAGDRPRFLGNRLASTALCLRWAIARAQGGPQSPLQRPLLPGADRSKSWALGSATDFRERGADGLPDTMERGRRLAATQGLLGDRYFNPKCCSPPAWTRRVSSRGSWRKRLSPNRWRREVGEGRVKQRSPENSIQIWKIPASPLSYL